MRDTNNVPEVESSKRNEDSTKRIGRIDSEFKSQWGEKMDVLTGGANRAVARLSSNHLRNVNNNIAFHIHILPYFSLNLIVASIATLC